MAKPRSKPVIQSSSLLNAISFVGSVIKDKGAAFETHVCLRDQWAVGTNGVLSAGHKIEEQLEAYPQNALFLAALEKCSEMLSITLLETNRLSIKSGGFKALVPCVEGDLMHFIEPDPPIAVIDDRFKKALETVGVLAAENAQSVVTASILMNGFSLIATDRKFIMEAWHGIDLPPGLTLPKAFVGPLTKAKKPLTGFGFSDASATFYFEDGSWLKTQTYADVYPDLNTLLNKEANLWSIPEKFFEAVVALEPFSEDGNIYFDNGYLRSHPSETVGASFEMAGTPKGVVYPARYLKMLNGLANKVDFITPHGNAYCLTFQGDNARGVIAGRAN